MNNPFRGRFHRYRADASEKAGLRQLCLAWDFWPYEELSLALEEHPYNLFYYEDESGWTGVVLLHLGPFSADIIYIYVLPSYRRKGLALKLMAFLKQGLQRQSELENIFLEVRTSNKAAQKLYGKAGMHQIGNRKKYYADGEDALVYSLELKGREYL